MRRQLVGTTVHVAPHTPVVPSQPVPLDTASLKKVAGGNSAPHRGW